jgi:hypothetical protein
MPLKVGKWYLVFVPLINIFGTEIIEKLAWASVLYVLRTFPENGPE